VANNLKVQERGKIEPPSQRGLRDKVYEICRMLLDQQKTAIVTLRDIESRICALREDFVTVMERKRPWATRD